MYCSLCFAAYNERTRQLFVEDPNLQVLIATDSLKVGNDFPNVADVVVLNPKDPNDIVQKTGRAGRVRGLVSDPRGIVYVTKAQVERAKSLIEVGISKGKRSTGATRKAEEEKMSPELARIIPAPCFPSELEESRVNYSQPIPSNEQRLSTWEVMDGGKLTLDREGRGHGRTHLVFRLLEGDIFQWSESSVHWTARASARLQ